MLRCFYCQACCKWSKCLKNKTPPFPCIGLIRAVLFRLKAKCRGERRKLCNWFFSEFALLCIRNCASPAQTGWQDGDLHTADTEASQMFRGCSHSQHHSATPPGSIPHWTISEITQCRHLKEDSFLERLSKNGEKEMFFFCSLMKFILSMVINITSLLLMESRAGLRAPACDHFYFRNLKRSAYMKNFTEAVNSEAIRERSTHFASVQPCSFLELSLIYTQGIGRKSRIHSLEV